MSEWISVRDRLPENGQTVLLHCDGCILMGVCRTKASTPFQSTYSGAQDPYGHEITHWMPLDALPPPPNEVTP